MEYELHNIIIYQIFLDGKWEEVTEMSWLAWAEKKRWRKYADHATRWHYK